MSETCESTDCSIELKCSFLKYFFRKVVSCYLEALFTIHLFKDFSYSLRGYVFQNVSEVKTLLDGINLKYLPVNFVTFFMSLRRTFSSILFFKVTIRKSTAIWNEGQLLGNGWHWSLWSMFRTSLWSHWRT